MLEFLFNKEVSLKVLENLPMFVFIEKQYPVNYAYLILTILELFAREVCKFLKK